MKTTLTQKSPGTKSHIDFGFNDDKGRAIGVSIVVTPYIVAEAKDEDKCYYLCFDAPGDYIGVRITATRNGYEFGAYQRTDYFETQAGADAAIVRRVNSTRARYLKKFGTAA